MLRGAGPGRVDITCVRRQFPRHCVKINRICSSNLNKVTRFRSLLSIIVVSLSSVAAEEKVSFAREILPILSDKCFYCHGPDKSHQKADLRLDIRADAIAADAVRYA